MKNAGMINRRRFERVPLALDWGKAHAIVGAEWHWSNHEVSQIFDMSYQGLAVSQAALSPAAMGQVIQGELLLGTLGRLNISARVAWAKGVLVGLELKDISIQARQIIERFLKDKLIGLHMKRVEPKFFLETADFDIWYHGPADTNVYLWQDKDGHIHRAEVEIGGSLLNFDRGRIEPEVDLELRRRVMALLSQISEPHMLLKELLTQLAKGMS